MNAKNILLVVFILLLLYIIIQYVYSSTGPLTTMQDGTTMTTISPSKLSPNSSGLNSGNFTYSVWFYVNDWNYRYGEPKVIFGRTTPSASNGSTIFDISGNDVTCNDPCMSVSLGAVQNNLAISLSCYNGDTTSTSDNSSVMSHCNISNVPIQRWVNLLVSVYGRTMDVYLDGKLVKTNLLPGIAKINSSAPVYLTPDGGFSGWTSKLQYFPNATDPQTAWNIYVAGYGGSVSSLFSNYKVKVAVYNGNSETSSLTI
jgi:hypothetical protein